MRHRPRGFTLIELMVVVAITGLLAALALPNFMRMQARAKQSEAKTHLKAIFTAEKSYYGDKQIFVDALDVVGFEPERNNRYGFYAGGNAAGVEDRKGAAITMSPAASNNCPGMNGVAYIAADNFKFGSGAAIGAGADPGPAVAMLFAATGTASASGPAAVTSPGVFDAKGADVTCCNEGVCDFEASAAGNIDNDAAWDGWIISSQNGPAATLNACSGAVASTKTSWDSFAAGEPVNVCNDLFLN